MYTMLATLCHSDNAPDLVGQSLLDTRNLCLYRPGQNCCYVLDRPGRLPCCMQPVTMHGYLALRIVAATTTVLYVLRFAATAVLATCAAAPLPAKINGAFLARAQELGHDIYFAARSPWWWLALCESRLIIRQSLRRSTTTSVLRVCAASPSMAVSRSGIVRVSTNVPERGIDELSANIALVR